MQADLQTDIGAIDVVLPVLNEASQIASRVAELRAAGFATVIVVDGGSEDDSLERAARAGARVIRARRGRGAQMNAGAAAGSAPFLLFLHADTRLPPDSAGAIASAMAAPGCVGGCFRLRFDSRRPLLRVFAWFSRFESRVTSFGDQGFFVRRTAFDQIGGFPDWPLLEDVELRRRLRRIGPFVKLRPSVVTSARRYEAQGVLRRQMLNGLILALHAAGAPAERLARWYR